MNWSVDDLLSATGGELAAGRGSGLFSGICIDSRVISAEQVFAAVKGSSHDGHSFVPELMEKGVRGFILERLPRDREMIEKWSTQGACLITVEDTVRALGDLAAYHRRRSGVRLAAVTGSNGKTSTKEMAASVAGLEMETLYTRGNLNNEIGLPLTLLRLEKIHKAAVVELGMNHPGEIRRLAEISSPDIGVITNIGQAHLEGLHDIDSVMHAKAELLEHIKRGGTAVLNRDDAYADALGAMARCRVLYFGFSDEADIRAEDVRHEGLKTFFRLVLPCGEAGIVLSAAGKYMLSNALAAAAVGYEMGVSKESIKAGLESFRPVSGRMKHMVSAGGINVIDDAYNANPGSMRAAIETLASLKAGNRAALVAGDMLELGEDSAGLHYEIGRAAASGGIDLIYLAGDFAEDTAKGALSAGMPKDRVFRGGKAGILDRLLQDLGPGDWVLVKGSRSTEMEKIAEQLAGMNGGPQGGRNGKRGG